MPDTIRLSAALSDRYRIEGELGQGGMATVYLARDLKHDREVALKVLRPELGAVLGPDRFLAEIKITARLDHPHILTLIDSGAEDGFLYYVLPLVRGESLREKLNREQQLSIDEALAITKQVASALEYAHRQGVIHRDIKPENILIQEGEAMLTDFGIALAVKQAGGNRLTETGLSLGTPQYMSPEQATGDRTLDARSDVYSLGAVLYEMLAGEPPVTGPNAQAMIAKLMTERPTALRVVRDTVPVGIDAAVAKALSKVPADRFPSASEFASALAAGSRTAELVRGRSWPVRPIVAAGLLIAALAVWWISTRGHRGETSSPFLTAVPTQLTTSGRAAIGVLSPDGSLVAYTEEHCGEANLCRGDLVVREIDGEGINTIVSQAGHRAIPAAWSPDGRWVLYMDADLGTGIYTGPYLVSQRGGAPRLIGRGNPQAGGFAAPDTLLLASFDLPQQWCRRVIALTGQVVDSVRLPVGRFVDVLLPSPDGTRLLVRHHAQFLSDSATWSVVDRAGHATDSLRLDSGSDALWDGGSGAVVLGLPIGSGPGRAFVRRRLDTRGRFIPGSDTLRIVPEGYAFLLGVGPDERELVYSMSQAGTTEAWTATRRDTRGAFDRGRLLGSSTGTLNVFLSPAGGWILVSTAPGANQTRIEVEPFTGGERRVVEPALSDFRELAFSPADDSMAVATNAGPGRTTFTVYPLPSGAPVLRGTFEGFVADLEWLSDGRLATAVDSGRVVRVFDRAGTVQDIPVPDSLGAAQSAGRSPFAPELALVSFAVRGNRVEAIVSRLDVGDGRFTPVARSSTFGDDVGNIWWTTDGWLHLQAGTRGTGGQLYRVPIAGGAFEAEPPIGFASNAEVASLSHDGKRAIVRVQSENTDLWVLRAAAPR